MSIGNIYNAVEMYQYTGKVQATAAGQTGVVQLMQNIMEAGTVKTDIATSIDAISRAYSVGKPNASNFKDAFPQYDVVTHVGNTSEWQKKTQ